MASMPVDRSGGLDWPGILADIAEAAGPMAALRVAEAKGGRSAYFPKLARLHGNHWLVVACGWGAAQAIIRRIGAGWAEVPLGPFAGNRGAVRRAIREGLAAGLSGPEIARRVGVTDRTVRNHKGRQPRDNGLLDQLQLF